MFVAKPADEDVEGSRRDSSELDGINPWETEQAVETGYVCREKDTRDLEDFVLVVVADVELNIFVPLFLISSVMALVFVRNTVHPPYGPRRTLPVSSRPLC